MRYLGLGFIPGIVVCRTQAKTDILATTRLVLALAFADALQVVGHDIHAAVAVAVGVAVAIDMSLSRRVDTSGTAAVGAIEMTVAGPTGEGRGRVGLVEKAGLAYGDPSALVQAGIMATVEPSFCHGLRGSVLVVLVVVTVVVNVIVVA